MREHVKKSGRQILKLMNHQTPYQTKWASRRAEEALFPQRYLSNASSGQGTEKRTREILPASQIRGQLTGMRKAFLKKKKISALLLKQSGDPCMLFPLLSFPGSGFIPGNRFFLYLCITDSILGVFKFTTQHREPEQNKKQKV